MNRLALAVLLVAATQTRADDAEAFRDEYEPHWTRLTSHLWRNVKLAGVAEVRDPLPWLDLFRGTLRFEAVAGDDTLVWLGRFEPKGLPPPAFGLTFTQPFPPFDQLVVFRGGGVAVYQSSPQGVGWFRSHGVVSPWGRRFDHWLCHTRRTECQLAWPLAAADIGRGPNAYYDPLRMTRLLHRAARPRQVAYGSARRGGRDTAVVAVGGDGMLAEWTYLNRTDHLVVERLFTHTFGGPLAEVPPVVGGVTVSYAAAQPGELPFPASVRGWRLGERGERQPAEEVTFTEYRRYVPSPAELDVEKRFGVRLSDFGPRPPLPPPGSYLDDSTDAKAQTPRPPPAEVPRNWLGYRLAALGVIAALTVAVAVWLRR